MDELPIKTELQVQLVNRIFDDALKIGQAVSAETADWDAPYLLREIQSVTQSMITPGRPEDACVVYTQSLRLIALATQFSTRLLQEDLKLMGIHS